MLAELTRTRSADARGLLFSVMDRPAPAAEADERWRMMLTSPAPYKRRRRIHARLPSAPRCKLCASPFGGIGGAWMTRRGHRRWPQNPKYCEGCFAMLRANHGGAEIECTLLFADVRGSTGLAEKLPPRDFNRLMGRFYDAGAKVLVEHDAWVDKFVGDEIIGIFVPALATEDHARRGVDAALALLRATGYGSAAGPWVPVGVGVNTGIAYVGSIGEENDTELTAMGDMVNVTARLSSVAGAGEILVTAASAAAAGLDAALERRVLDLKGKTERVEVVVLGEPVSTS
jgi:adenylate cyclase